MKLQPAPGGVQILFDFEEAAMLNQLVHQLILLIQSHSGTALDPDPLFASLEVGGSEETPTDPALARLFPDAFADDDDAAAFRRVTEQGLINRKLQDAMRVVSDVGPTDQSEFDPVGVVIDAASFPAWARTITAVRLAIAARIGLESVEDHARLVEDDVTRGTVLVFDWLAALLEAVLALGAATSESDAAEEDPEVEPESGPETGADGASDPNGASSAE